MKTLSVIILLSALSACDAPQKTRFPTNSTDYTTVQGFDNGSGNSGCETSYEENCGQNTNSTNGSNTNSTNGTTTTATNGSTEPGFESCTNTTPFYGGSIGYFGLCRHSQDERQYKALFNQSDLTVGTCFVPIHIEGGKSFKLGRAECVHNQANQNYYMTLYKERPEEINGVMVLKASAVNSYMQCMNAKANYIASYPGCQYNAQCLAAADQYAYTVCNSFVQQHSNDYKQVEFN